VRPGPAAQGNFTNLVRSGAAAAQQKELAVWASLTPLPMTAESMGSYSAPSVPAAPTTVDEEGRALPLPRGSLGVGRPALTENVLQPVSCSLTRGTRQVAAPPGCGGTHRLTDCAAQHAGAQAPLHQHAMEAGNTTGSARPDFGVPADVRPRECSTALPVRPATVLYSAGSRAAVAPRSDCSVTGVWLFGGRYGGLAPCLQQTPPPNHTATRSSTITLQRSCAVQRSS
jgi:hypothetical protein